MIIAFEGLDCTGKATLSKILKGDLKDYINVELPELDESFYSTEFIKKHLSGEQKIQDIWKYFTFNREETFKKIGRKDNIIFDRYSLSNFIYHSEKLERIIDMERLCCVPKADITILLNVEFEEIKQRLLNKNKKDIYEQDIVFLKKCYDLINSNYFKENVYRFTNELIEIKVPQSETIKETYKKILTNLEKYDII